MTKYLIDANVLIQAKNLYYRFDFCMAFWTWIEDAHKANLAYSIRKVRAELMATNKTDPARTWAAGMAPSFFLDESEGACMATYGTVISWAQGMAQYKPKAKQVFASYNNADAFLVAVAKTHGYDIVTHEKPTPNSQANIALPDAAKAMNVQTHFIYDVLSQHATPAFKYK